MTLLRAERARATSNLDSIGYEISHWLQFERETKGSQAIRTPYGCPNNFDGFLSFNHSLSRSREAFREDVLHHDGLVLAACLLS